MEGEFNVEIDDEEFEAIKKIEEKPVEMLNRTGFAFSASAEHCHI